MTNIWVVNWCVTDIFYWQLHLYGVYSLTNNATSMTNAKATIIEMSMASTSKNWVEPLQPTAMSSPTIFRISLHSIHSHTHTPLALYAKQLRFSSALLQLSKLLYPLKCIIGISRMPKARTVKMRYIVPSLLVSICRTHWQHTVQLTKSCDVTRHIIRS